MGAPGSTLAYARTLDDGAGDDFVAALDAPVELAPAVRMRYTRPPQWDR